MPGKVNVLADCFSQLLRIDSVSDSSSEPLISGRGRPSSPQSVMNFDASFDCADATHNRS